MGKYKDNKWRRRGDETIEIVLTQGQVALVDECDLDTVLEYRWHAQRRRRGWCARAYAGGGCRDARKVFMHRLILDAPAGVSVDHANMNGLDNRRINLRFATLSQNMANQRKRRDKTSSKYKGVWYDRRRKRPWRAEIEVRGRRKRLGTFDTEEEAALAYNRAALEYFGEFARLNQVEA